MTEHAFVRPQMLPRLSLRPLTTFVAAVLFLAGAIHIVTILLVPAFAGSDGWSRLAAFGGVDQFTPVPVADGAGGVVGLDPLFVNGACRLQLDEAPAAITLDAQDRFWSLALYDRQGTILFSINDRTAADGQLEMLVVNPDENAALKKSPPSDIDQTVVVESPSNDLIALLRLYAPTDANQRDARRTLTQAECVPSPLDPVALDAGSGSGG